MIALNFLSSDDRIKYAIPCLLKDLFVDVEKKIYEKFPQYIKKIIFSYLMVILLKSLKQ